MPIFEIEIHQPMKLNDLPGKCYNIDKGCYGKCITTYQNTDYINQMLDSQLFEKTCPNTLTKKEELLKDILILESKVT